jgi:hypothetical protein
LLPMARMAVRGVSAVSTDGATPAAAITSPRLQTAHRSPQQKWCKAMRVATVCHCIAVQYGQYSTVLLGSDCCSLTATSSEAQALSQAAGQTMHCMHSCVYCRLTFE